MPTARLSGDDAAAPALPAGVLRYYNFLPPGHTLADDVHAGLGGTQKAITPRWHFDEAGMRIQRARAEFPSWYQARDEAMIVSSALDELAQLIGPGAQFMEIGPGASTATVALAERIAPALHVQIDSDPAALAGAAQRLTGAFPWLNICGILANPALPLVLPEFVGLSIQRKVAFVPAAALVRFTPDQLYEVLRALRQAVGRAGAVLAAIDLKKDHKRLDDAYNDAEGLGALFASNPLARVNAELGADFQPERFDYRAAYDEVRGRVEMRLVSRYAQFVRVGGRRHDFASGESLLADIASLYTAEEFTALARDAGLAPQKEWADERRHLSLHWLAVA